MTNDFFFSIFQIHIGCTDSEVKISKIEKKRLNLNFTFDHLYQSKMALSEVLALRITEFDQALVKYLNCHEKGMLAVQSTQWMAWYRHETKPNVEPSHQCYCRENLHTVRRGDWGFEWHGEEMLLCSCMKTEIMHHIFDYRRSPETWDSYKKQKHEMRHQDQCGCDVRIRNANYSCIHSNPIHNMIVHHDVDICEIKASPFTKKVVIQVFKEMVADTPSNFVFQSKKLTVEKITFKIEKDPQLQQTIGTIVMCRKIIFHMSEIKYGYKRQYTLTQTKYIDRQTREITFGTNFAKENSYVFGTGRCMGKQSETLTKYLSELMCRLFPKFKL